MPICFSIHVSFSSFPPCMYLSLHTSCHPSMHWFIFMFTVFIYRSFCLRFRRPSVFALLHIFLTLPMFVVSLFFFRSFSCCHSKLSSFKPSGLSYMDGLTELKLSALVDRREFLCKRFYVNNFSSSSNISDLLPKRNPGSVYIILETPEILLFLSHA